MADWNDFQRYIRTKYQGVKELQGGGFEFECTLTPEQGGASRAQKVIVSNVGGSWVQIATIVCREQDVAPRDALMLSATLQFGGLALYEGFIILRHSFPLADFDPSEFDVPLALTATYGDELERQLTGGDLW
jgi:hypothetical protein